MTGFAYPLVAIRDDGTTITARTPAEAAAFNRLRPGPSHRQGHLWIAAIGRDGPIWRENVVRHEWIVRDDEGRTVLHEELPKTDAPHRGWRHRRLATIREAAERGLPIPGTGRGHRYSMGYRGFRANIAMRAAEAALEADLADWGLDHMRVGRRRADRLPQVWDDVPYRHLRRCWKHYRKTRWKGW